MRNKYFMFSLLLLCLIAGMNGVWTNEKGNLEDCDYVMQIDVTESGYIFYFIELLSYEKELPKKEYERRVFVEERDLSRALCMYKEKYGREADISRVELVKYVRVNIDRKKEFLEDIENEYSFPPELFYELYMDI